MRRSLLLLPLALAAAGCGGSATAPRATVATTAAPAPAPTPTPVASVVTPLKPAAKPAAATPRPAPKPRTHAAKPKPKPRPVPLPVSSPWALPPMLNLHARRAGGSAGVLRRRVLRSSRIALSPQARRAVVAGKVSRGALALLLRVPPTGGPLLVFQASGADVRAQETTLWMTRRAVRALSALPAPQRPVRLLLEPVESDTEDLAGPPKPKPGDLHTLAGLYRAAGYQYGIDWRILAAINKVETGFGTNLNVSSAGAVGWMQFMPSTWRRWGTDGSGDGVADPWNPADAVFSAARYLQAAGAERDIRRAVFAYNHADWYVNDVLKIASSIPDDYGQR